MDGYTFDPPDWRDAQVTKRDRLFRYGKPGVYPDYRLFDEASLHPGLMDPPEEFERKMRELHEIWALMDTYERIKMEEFREDK